VEFQVSVIDLRRPGNPIETDCAISPISGHRIADLIGALQDAVAPSNWSAGGLSVDGWGASSGDMRGWGSASSRTETAGLWLNGSQLPEGQLLTDTGIRAGSRLGLGGPVPEGDQWRSSAGGTFPVAMNGSMPEPLVSVYADPGDPFFQVVHKQPRAGLSHPGPIAVSAGPVAPATPPAMPGMPWLQLLLGPGIAIASSAALGAAMGGRDSWLFLLVGLGGTAGTLVPQLISLRKSRKAAREQAEQTRQAEAASSVRLANSASAVADAIAAEELFLRRLLPDPESVVKIATRPGRRLWERSPGDEDFLRIRLGTGDLPAASVTVRGEQSASTPWAPAASSLSPGLSPSGGSRPAAAAQVPTVRDVPIAADLGALGVLGIAGDPRLSRGTLAWTVMQLAVAHGPSDLRLVFLTDDQAAWRWTRWLPHVRPLGDPDGWLNVGTDQASRHKRVTELRDLIGSRLGGAGNGPGTGRVGGLGVAGGPPPRGGAPWGAPLGCGSLNGGGFTGYSGQLPAVVVVIDGYARVRDIPGIDEVLAYGPAAGVLVMCRDNHRRELPRYCAALLEGDPASGSGLYQERDSGRREHVTRLDRVRGRWADQVGRALAPLRDRTTDTVAHKGGPIRLNELWNYEHIDPAVIEELWRRRNRSTHVPLGKLPDGLPFRLDIAKDGPHMLVGGTTGSGKSEFLQTFIASLVHANPPDALNFVLVDYKGGAAFEAFSGLPHVTGFLRNLDDHLGKRVLLALSAEMKYRQRLLAEAKCSSIESYWAAGSPRGPLPRLLIVVDEFARLKEEMPEVLAEMTKVTVIGRSVGVHLVLATQRPAGVVTPDIQANTALRLVLRVEDAQDSTAVIGIPDAHLISKKDPGRGFAGTESSIVTPFQGAYVGGPADGGASAAAGRPRAPLTASVWPFEKAGLPTQPRDSDAMSVPGSAPAGGVPLGPTDLSVLVDAVRATRRQAPPRKVWLDPLPLSLPLSALAPLTRRGAGLTAPLRYGMGDLPAEQRQVTAAFDVESGLNLLIGGASQTGKTTALRTLAAEIASRCSPDDVHLYVLDCDTGTLGLLERLPHCGAVIRHLEDERAARLFDRLESEVERRKNLLADGGFASAGEQRSKVSAKDRLPYLVLLLDGWEEFNTRLGQSDGNRLAASLTKLATQGTGAGLRVIATGGVTALGKLSSSFAKRIVLRLSGPHDVAGAGVPKGAMPANPGPGRGVLLPSATEIQLSYAGSDPGGAAQTTALSDLIETARYRFPAPMSVPLRVDLLPSRISLSEALTKPGWPGRGALQPVLAVGGDDLGWCGPDLARYPGFAIAGPALSGKSTALMVLAESLLAAGSEVLGLAPRESALRGLDGRDGVLAVLTADKPDPEKLVECIKSAGGPLAVLVDDAELLVGHPSTEEILSKVLAIARDRGGALVVASSAAHLGRATRSFLTAVPQLTRCGLLLTPEDRGQAMLFGARLPGNSVFTRPAGRGFLFQANQAVLVQVPELLKQPAGW
jgi:DNA segregation ATPase FtsK/SpoIIIE, S-DNA-T family